MKGIRQIGVILHAKRSVSDDLDLFLLDLFLMDLEGRILALSDRGLNGQSELISAVLPAGRYVVEVRSFYTHSNRGALVFNAGAYRLELSLP